MKRGIALALAASLAVASLATGALADDDEVGKDDDEVKSKISLSNSEPGVYEGTVSSKLAACRKQRRVKVYHDENGDGIDRFDYRIGKDLTDRKGSYEVKGSQAPMGDHVIAEVRGRSLPDGTYCLDDEKTIAALSG